MKVLFYPKAPIARVKQGTNGDREVNNTPEKLQELANVSSIYLTDEHPKSLSDVFGGVVLGHVANIYYDKESELLHGDVYVTELDRFMGCLGDKKGMLSIGDIDQKLTHVALVKDGWCGIECSLTELVDGERIAMKPELKELDPDNSILSTMKDWSGLNFMRQAFFEEGDQSKRVYTQEIKKVFNSARQESSKITENASKNAELIKTISLKRIENAEAEAAQIIADAKAEAASILADAEQDELPDPELPTIDQIDDLEELPEPEMAPAE